MEKLQTVWIRDIEKPRGVLLCRPHFPCGIIRQPDGVWAVYDGGHRVLRAMVPGGGFLFLADELVRGELYALLHWVSGNEAYFYTDSTAPERSREHMGRYLKILAIIMDYGKASGDFEEND